MNLFYLATIFYSMFPKEDLHHCNWDVTILYHEKNIDTVRTICQNLSHKEFNIAFKEKDFRPGALIQDESARLMFNSQCIVVLLSQDYLNTHECCEEFKNAKIAEKEYSKK